VFESIFDWGQFVFSKTKKKEINTQSIYIRMHMSSLVEIYY